MRLLGSQVFLLQWAYSVIFKGALMHQSFEIHILFLLKNLAGNMTVPRVFSEAISQSPWKALKFGTVNEGIPQATLRWECTSKPTPTLHAQIESKYISKDVTLFRDSKTGTGASLLIYLLSTCAWKVLPGVKLSVQRSPIGSHPCDRGSLLLEPQLWELL